jgi:tetratricopeptide (TPR) repeat protein
VCRRLPAESAGVVVDAVGKGGAAARAGLLAGDVLVSWQRSDAAGSIESPFDITVIENEDGWTGLTTLIATRGGRGLTASMPPGEWRLETRAPLTPPRLQRHEQARQLASKGDHAQAAQAWRALAEETPAGTSEGAWLAGRAGDALFNAGKAADAQATFTFARTRAAADAELVAMLWEREGLANARARRRTEAISAYREALALQAAAGRKAAAARLHSRIGRMAFERDDFATGADEYARCLSLQQQVSARSPRATNALMMLGWAAERQGDLVEAEKRFHRALEMARSVAPRSSLVAETLGGLGNIADNRGDVAAAEAFHREALPIYEKAGFESAAAATLRSLGMLARNRGDLDGAMDHYRRALALAEAQDPNGISAANALAGTLTSLGLVALARGDLAEAEALHRRSLAVSTRVTPEGALVASSLHNLARVAEARGDGRAGEELYRRSLAIKRRLGLANRSLSATLFRLGEATGRRGDLRSAGAFHVEALAIRQKIGPGTALEAESLNALCRLSRQKGDRVGAIRYCLAALEALERHRGRQRRSDAGEALSATYASFYRDTIDLLLAAGRREEALQVLERSRARALLTLIAQRDLVFAGDVDPALRREQKRLDALYDHALDALEGLGSGRDPDPAKEDALRARLRALRASREQVAARIRQAAPRLAALQDPQPLDARGVRAALDAGTALVSFSVGAERTTVFVSRSSADAGAAPLSVYSVPLGEDVLRLRVLAFRGLIERGRDEAALDGALTTQGERLYRELLGPAEAALAGSRRLLISPDGPLHALPLAALVRRIQPLEYLAEWKPLHVVVSATVYAEVRKSRTAAAGPALVAFGDPRPVRQLKPLGASAAEVNDIAALFGGQANTYLREAATESRAKTVGSARYIHFASHGLLDPRSPLDSALALTPSPGPGGDNGLLQAWEVFDTVRLYAELVTLSACETGLGKEMGGEGLIGLTRAFQHAGARSVVASLWAISDRSTAVLMRRFYERLQAGAPKDEALQAAQVALLRGAGTAHPFHWAAFQVNGDWR